MEPDNLSIEQLNISFGEFHDSAAGFEQDSLSDLWQSFRTERGEENARELRPRTDNGRKKKLSIPKLTVRRNSGSSLSSTSSDPLFPIEGRRFSVPKCGSPIGLRETRSPEPKKLLGIEQFMKFQEENGRRTTISHGKARDPSQMHSTQVTPGAEHGKSLNGNRRLLSGTEIESAATNYENLTSRSERGFADKLLPALDKPRTRRFSAPSSPSNFTRQGRYTSANSVQIPADILTPPARKKTLSPLSSQGTLSSGRDLEKQGRKISADGSSYISSDDFKIPFSTKIAEQLENEICLIKGQKSIDKKKNRYSLTAQPFQDIAPQGIKNPEHEQEEPILARRSLRTSNQTVQYTSHDMFDPMFEA